jgi:thiol-disulfide isomerase/thioredoxin
MLRLPNAGPAVLATALTMGVVCAASAQTPPTAPPPGPSKGDIVPAFETLGVDGKPQKVDFPKGSKTVLLIFSSGCPHCQKMIPEWNSAYERKPKDLRVVGMLTDHETPTFWTLFPVSFRVVRSPGYQFLRDLKVNRVPLMLRVAEGGRIEEVLSGETDPIRLGELFRP